jgi:tetratricopeptide (TPR) repeat protein
MHARTKNGIIAGALVLSVTPLVWEWWHCLPSGLVPTFVGSSRCADCHRGHYQRSARSWHSLAGASLSRSEFPIVAGDDWVVDEQERWTASRGDRVTVNRYETKHGTCEEFTVCGGLTMRGHRYYILEDLAGSRALLPFRWDNDQRWSRPPVQFAASRHWRSGACAICHLAERERSGHEATSGQVTCIDGQGAQCEACHGPGSIHVSIAERRMLLWDRRYGKGIVALNEPNPRIQTDACGRCHSSWWCAYRVSNGGGEALDNTSPVLPHDKNRPAAACPGSETDLYGRFRLSRMYREGVRCSDCHSAHTGELVRKGNDLCTSCHHPGQFDHASHHRHASGSEGSYCINCHMPLVAGSAHRRDHFLRIPRVGTGQLQKVPDACAQCHASESPAWAREHLSAGTDRHMDALYPAEIADMPLGDDQSTGRLTRIAADSRVPAMARASAMLRLAPDGSSDRATVIANAIESDDAVLRIAAIRQIGILGRDRALEELRVLLLDPVRFVRIEALSSLASWPETIDRVDRSALNRILAEYGEACRFTNSPYTWNRLGLLCAALGKWREGDSAFDAALVLDQDYVPSLFNRSVLMLRTGDPRAVAVLRRVVRLVPAMPDGNALLGLKELTLGDMESAFLHLGAGMQGSAATSTCDGELLDTHVLLDGWLDEWSRLAIKDPQTRAKLLLLLSDDSTRRRRKRAARDERERYRASPHSYQQWSDFFERIRARAERFEGT